MKSRCHRAGRTAGPGPAESSGPIDSTVDVVSFLPLPRWEFRRPLVDSRCCESSSNCTNVHNKYNDYTAYLFFADAEVKKRSIAVSGNHYTATGNHMSYGITVLPATRQR